jgi:glycosyltransferase involved in cell wall biosynthesis
VSPAVDRLVPVTRVGAGWAAAPGELDAVLRRLESLDGRERARRARAARALAARYDWAGVAARYEAVFAEIVGRAPASPRHQSDA